MAISITVPANPQSVGNNGHTTDHNTISTALSTLGSAAANVNGDTFTGLVSLSAGFTVPVTTVTGTAYTALSTDRVILANTASNAITVTLPTAVSKTGYSYTVKNTGSTNLATIATTSSQTIDGGTNYYVPATAYVQMVSDGSNWQVIDESAYEPVQVYATGGLASFTTQTDIPGAAISVTVRKNNSTVVITGVFDMASKAAAMQGFAFWNGTGVSGTSVVVTGNLTTTQTRTAVAGTWLVTGVSAGTYTAKLQASCTASDSGNQVRTGITSITVDVR